MSFPFLSEPWFDAVRAIRDKYADKAPHIPVALQMNIVVTDVPFSAEPIELYMDTSSGALVTEQGQLADADPTLTTDWTTARALFVDQDPAVFMQAFLGGQIRIQGDLMKLMSLQATMPVDDIAITVAKEIQAITE